MLVHRTFIDASVLLVVMISISELSIDYCRDDVPTIVDRLVSRHEYEISQNLRQGDGNDPTPSGKLQLCSMDLFPCPIVIINF